MSDLTIQIDPATADYVLVRADGFAIGVAHDNATSSARENAYLWATAPLLKAALIQISVLAYDAAKDLDNGNAFDVRCALGEIVGAVHNALAASEPPLSGEAGQ